jgi:hypothetical protein
MHYRIIYLNLIKPHQRGRGEVMDLGGGEVEVSSPSKGTGISSPTAHVNLVYFKALRIRWTKAALGIAPTNFPTTSPSRKIM